MSFDCTGTDEPDIVDLDTVRAEIYPAVANMPSSFHFLAHSDFDNFRQFYNAFGPEQRATVVRGYHRFLGKLQEQGDVLYFNRILHDQYMILSKSRYIGETIWNAIRNEVFPLARPKLEPANGVHPQRVGVHLGVLGFTPSPNLDLEGLLTRVTELTKEAKDKTPPIHYETAN